MIIKTLIRNRFLKVYLVRIASNIIWHLSFQKFLFQKISLPLHLVTAASANHFYSLLNLLRTIDIYEPKATVSIWDIGLEPQQRKKILQKYPRYVLNTFDFVLYPEHFDLRAETYSWKPIIIKKESHNTDKIILWLDSGNILLGKLSKIKKVITKKHFFSPFSSDDVRRWTHISMIEHFDLDEKKLSKPNLNGAIVGFRDNSKGINVILDTWVECAFKRECIAPAGSSRLNHRQDQAALTSIAYRHDMAPKGYIATRIDKFNLLTHQDID